MTNLRHNSAVREGENAVYVFPVISIRPLDLHSFIGQREKKQTQL